MKIEAFDSLPDSLKRDLQHIVRRELPVEHYQCSVRKKIRLYQNETLAHLAKREKEIRQSLEDTHEERFAVEESLREELSQIEQTFAENPDFKPAFQEINQIIENFVKFILSPGPKIHYRGFDSTRSWKVDTLRIYAEKYAIKKRQHQESSWWQKWWSFSTLDRSSP